MSDVWKVRLLIIITLQPNGLIGMHIDFIANFDLELEFLKN